MALEERARGSMAKTRSPRSFRTFIKDWQSNGAYSRVAGLRIGRAAAQLDLLHPSASLPRAAIALPAGTARRKTRGLSLRTSCCSAEEPTNY